MIRFSSFGMRLMVIVVLTMVPMGGLILYTGAEARRYAAADAIREAQLVVNFTSATQDRLIEEGERFLAGLAQLHPVREQDLDACRRIFITMQNEYECYSNIGLVNLNGDVICSAKPMKSQVNIGAEPVFQRTTQAREFTVGNYAIGLITGKAMVPLNYPVFNMAGGLRGMVYAALDLGWLNRFAAQTELPRGSTLEVFDQSGKVLVHHPDTGKWVGKSVVESSVFNAILAQQGRGTAESSGLDGIPRLYAFNFLHSEHHTSDVYVSIGIPAAVAYERVNRIQNHVLAGLGIVTLLTLGVGWVSSHVFILRQVKILLRATSRLGTGDLGVRSGLPYGRGELGLLAQAFDEMADDLEMRNAEVMRSENELRKEKDKAQKYVERLKALREMDRAILALQSPLDIAKVALGHVRKLVPCLRANVVTFDRQRGEAKVLVGDVDGRTNLGSGIAISIEEFGLFEECGRDKINVVEDVLSRPDPPPIIRVLREEGIRSCINVRIESREELLGFLNLVSQTPGTFGGQHAEIAKEVADSLGVALQNAKLIEQIKRHQRELERHSARLITAQEEERRRISLELHDEVGQALTAININLATIQKKLSPEMTPAVKAKLQDAASLAEQVSDQIHELSLALRPSMLDDLGLVPSLQWLLRKFAERSDIVVDFEAPEYKERLSPSVEVTLYRVVQEALNNIVKHAEATRVLVHMECADNTVRIFIRDDGKGFNLRGNGMSDAPKGGAGLVGIRERVALLGGNFSIRTEPGRGTHIDVSITLKEHWSDERDKGIAC